MSEESLWRAIVVASKGLENGNLDELYALIDTLSVALLNKGMNQAGMGTSQNFR
jgi:hypothetical protein